MSPKRDDSIDRLVTQVSEEIRSALSRAFDIEAGLARVRQAALEGSAARKTALAEEAERLAEVDWGWEDAAVRLAEIGDLWRTAGSVDPDLEQALKRRFLTARRSFSRRHKVTFAAKSRRIPRPLDHPRGEIANGLSIAEAERQLRDLLDTEPPDRYIWRNALTAMTEYCLSTIISWLRMGHVPVPCPLTAAQLRRLTEPWTVEQMTQVASEVASRVVMDFRDHRLPRGLWKQEQGVTLAEDLLLSCAATLPGALRKLLRHQPPVRAGQPDSSVNEPAEPPSLTAAALALRAAGYSRAETAEVLRLPDARAVSRAIGQQQVAAEGRHV